MEEMRCLMFGRVIESVWKGLMLNTIGTMSRSSHKRVHRFGACHRHSVICSVGFAIHWTGDRAATWTHLA